MDIAVVSIAVLSILAIGFAQAWLIIIISRKSPFAALLCLIAPFLPLFFIKDHWKEAKPAVMTWLAGAVGFSLSAIAAPFLE